MTFGKNFYKNPIIWTVLILVFYTSLRFLAPTPGPKVKQLTLTELVKYNEASKIVAVEMGLEFIKGVTNNGENFVVAFPIYYSGKLIDDFIKKGVNIKYTSAESERSTVSKAFNIIGTIMSWLPFAIIMWIMFGISKGSGGNKGGGGIFGGGALSFGKNKARMIHPNDLKIKFDDVAGINEAKEDVKEIVDFLKSPQRYQKIGGRIPKGCLLSGQPGTGKTMLAKAIASEAGVPFFFSSGSDFVEMFVGVGASRVRDMFAQAKRNAPCIIFIDEIDAVGRSRGVGVGGGNDEREQTLNQLLVEMDGFEDNIGVVVIAATNRVDVLDNALTRPGRFDRQIVVNLPDLNGREQILHVHTKNVKMSPAIDLRIVARGTSGFSGADLANLINEAALLAARNNKQIVTNDDIEQARDKILMGNERKLMVMRPEEKKLTAYHEGAHALVAINLPHSDPVHKATIIPRGHALGLVMRLPEYDRLSMTRARMFADLAVAMAGRIAEEIIFGYDYVTSGASSDIEQATKIARLMVTKWGLSDRLGTVNYSDNDNRQYGQSRHISEQTAIVIDSEIKAIVQSGYDTAKDIICSKIDDLHKIANALLEFETMTGDEIIKLLAGTDISENKAPQSNNTNSLFGMAIKQG